MVLRTRGASSFGPLRMDCLPSLLLQTKHSLDLDPEIDCVFLPPSHSLAIGTKISTEKTSLTLSTASNITTTATTTAAEPTPFTLQHTPL